MEWKKGKVVLKGESIADGFKFEKVKYCNVGYKVKDDTFEITFKKGVVFHIDYLVFLDEVVLYEYVEDFGEYVFVNSKDIKEFMSSGSFILEGVNDNEDDILNTEEINLFFELYKIQKEFAKEKKAFVFHDDKTYTSIKDEKELRDGYYKMEKYIDLKMKLNLFYGYKFTQIEEILDTVDELMSVDLNE